MEVVSLQHSMPDEIVDSVVRKNIPSPSRNLPSKSELVKLFPTFIPRFISNVIEDKADPVVDTHFMPEFEFRRINGFPSPTSSQLRETRAHFPGATGVFFAPPFLTIVWRSLPPKPWPLTFGLIPIFYTTSGNLSRTPTFGRGATGKPIRTSMSFTASHPPDTLFLTQVLEDLVTLKVNPVLIAWCGGSFYVELLSATTSHLVPSSIANIHVAWKVKIYRESCTDVLPVPGQIVDTSSYEKELRPGVYIQSHCKTRATTSGIPLEKDGKCFITVANHGFPDSNHVRNSSREIGVIQQRFCEANVGLVRLHSGLQYSDVTFSGLGTGTVIKGMTVADEVPLAQQVYFNSPFNGQCNGILVAKGVSVEVKAVHNNKAKGISQEPEVVEYTYQTIHMAYFGNGLAQDIEAGTCGAVIWDDTDHAIGFFRFYDCTDGVVYAPAIDILVHNGFEVAPIKVEDTDSIAFETDDAEERSVNDQ